MNQQVLSTKFRSTIRNIWENLEISICIITMIAMVVIIFAQVVGRYVFNYSFSWSEEIARFFMVWMTFAGSAYAFRKGAHIGVTALVDKLPKRFSFYVKLLSRFLTIFFFIVLGYYGWQHTANQFAIGQVAPATRIPVAVPYSALPIGSFLIILRLIEQTIREIKDRHESGGDKK